MRKLLLLCAFFVSGCMAMTYRPPGPAPERSTATVSASFGRTWDAVIDMFARRNIPISTIDRSSGFIATQQLTVGAGGEEWADCGTDMGIRMPPTHATYNVLVRGDSASSTVRMTVTWASTIQSGGSANNYQCVTTGVWEDEAEAAVAAAAERR